MVRRSILAVVVAVLVAAGTLVWSGTQGASAATKVRYFGGQILVNANTVLSLGVHNASPTSKPATLVVRTGAGAVVPADVNATMSVPANFSLSETYSCPAGPDCLWSIQITTTSTLVQPFARWTEGLQGFPAGLNSGDFRVVVTN